MTPSLTHKIHQQHRQTGTLNKIKQIKLQKKWLNTKKNRENNLYIGIRKHRSSSLSHSRLKMFIITNTETSKNCCCQKSANT